jgi:hypothetical protein
MADKPRVGFIGIGNMGWPMASCLVKAGFPVRVNDARREVANNFVQQIGGSAPDTMPGSPSGCWPRISRSRCRSRAKPGRPRRFRR